MPLSLRITNSPLNSLNTRLQTQDFCDSLPFRMRAFSPRVSWSSTVTASLKSFYSSVCSRKALPKGESHVTGAQWRVGPTAPSVFQSGLAFRLGENTAGETLGVEQQGYILWTQPSSQLSTLGLARTHTQPMRTQFTPVCLTHI